MTTHFSDVLAELRHKAGLTNKQLAEKAGVPRSLIAGLQSGKRRVGEKNARQIAQALNLEGEDLLEFIFMAIDTSTVKVLKDVQGYPAQLINAVGWLLRQSGILPDSVMACTNPDPASGNLTLTLEAGRTARLSTKVLLA